ncbi:MAG: MBL fold metallo-hydrolase [Burkholderiales bacterium]|nr:MBL fold metallo-hydrolase [Burkholderiales bacterium]
MNLPFFVEPCGPEVYAVDTGFQRERFDAAYLVTCRGRAAFIDTGTRFALPRLLGALDALGLARNAVDYVIPTHVHLDHAGGAGALMAELPAARLVVHPRGAPHLIDPGRLWEGALAVYGAEEMARSYGALTPVPAERVLPSVDGMKLELGGRELLFADTPGHARHHHCIWDAASRGWFCGDTFGLSYREFDSARGRWILPTTTPVQFEPEALRASIERLLSFAPDCLYLTHFGRVTDVPRLGALLLDLLERTVAMARALSPDAQREPALRRGLFEIYAASLAEHGCPLGRSQLEALLEIDLRLNAQGMSIWLGRGR